MQGSERCACAAAPAGRVRAARSLGAVALGVLIAFFPRCPMCWAAYMSMFGSVWLARTPYLGWLFPALLALAGLHLLLLLRAARRSGYAPVLLSVVGTALIVVGRSLPHERWLLWTGMCLMAAGSLLSGYSAERFANSVSLLTKKRGRS
jgi:hypothetical protein